MSFIHFAGTSYTTLRAAARAFAVHALPDVSVAAGDEDPHAAACDIEAREWDLAQDIGEGAPVGLGTETWRSACRVALTERINAHRDR